MNVRVVRGLLSAVAVLTVAFFALRPDRIVVERVVFEGVDRAPLGELRHMADVENGTTLWSVDVAAVAANVERHPWVRAASVERRWPDALVVRVEERVPRLMVAWGGTLYYVDERGVPFLVAEPDDLDHPLLIGLSEELDAVNPKLSWLVLHDTLWLLEALESRKLVATADVAQITFERTRGYTFTLKGGMRGRRTSEILIVPGDYERQLDHLERVLQEGVKMGAPVRIDVAPPRVALVRRLEGEEPEPARPAPGGTPTASNPLAGDGTGQPPPVSGDDGGALPDDATPVAGETSVDAPKAQGSEGATQPKPVVKPPASEASPGAGGATQNGEASAREETEAP